MDAIADQYSDGGYLAKHQTWHVEDSPWKAQQIRKLLARNGVEPKSFAEIGCGAGEILTQLSRAFPSARFVGYEVSPQAFDLCRTRATERVQFRLQDMLSESPAQDYDCLLCIDVFEHVEDYIGFTRALGPKAKHVVFHIPLEISVFSIFRGLMLKQRKGSGHLHYFTRETALAALADAGFRVLDDFYTTPFIDFPAGTRKRRLFKPIYKAMYRLAPQFTVRVFGFCSLMVLATAH